MLIVVLSNLRDLQFTWTSSDELNVWVPFYQWEVSSPVKTQPPLLSLTPSPCPALSFFSSALICDWLISLLFRNTGRLRRTARFCFLSTINHTEHSISFTCSSSVPAGWVMFLAQLGELQGHRSLMLLTGEFLFNSHLTMTFTSPVLPCVRQISYSNLERHAKQPLRLFLEPWNVWLQEPACTFYTHRDYKSITRA